jgi:hypothetical protein
MRNFNILAAVAAASLIGGGLGRGGQSAQGRSRRRGE